MMGIFGKITAIKDHGEFGFTLVELLVVVAVLGILVAIAVPQFTQSKESAETAVDQANLATLNSTTGLYQFSSATADGDVFQGINSDEERMQELVEAGFISDIIEPAQDDYMFTWNIGLQIWKLTAEDSSVTLSPLGSAFTEISTNMISIMQKEYADTGSYGRSWGDYRYTDLGLDPADWSKPINHIYYKPSGEDLLITPEQGYTIVVKDLNGNEKYLHSTLNWNLVYSDKDGQWYYHSIKEENKIDISALKVVFTN